MRSAQRIAAATFAAATAATVGGAGMVVTSAASAATPPKAITVTMSAKAITFAATSIPAGKVVFTVTSAKGNHTLQLGQLHSGYTEKQAEHDINAGSEVFAFPLHVEPHVVDDNAQPGMARRDFTDCLYGERRKNHHGNVVALAIAPEPVRGAVVEE